MTRAVIRWASTLTLGAAVIAALLLPFETWATFSFDWWGYRDPALNVLRRRLAHERDALRESTPRLLAARLLAGSASTARATPGAAPRATPGTTDAAARGWLVDPALPPALRDRAEQVGREEWARLGPSADPNRERILFVAAGDSALGRRLAPLPRVTQLPPGSLGQSACLTVVVLATDQPLSWNTHVAPGFSGRCGFEAAFGPAGAGVLALRPALTRRADWNAPEPTDAVVRAGAWQLGVSGLACLAGRLTACDALFEPASRVSREQVPFEWSDQRAFGSGAARVVASMAAELGPERFGRLWRDDAPIAESFRRETGGELRVWTRDYLRRRYEPPPRGAFAGMVPTVWGVLLLVGLLAAAVRSPRGAVTRGA